MVSWDPVAQMWAFYDSGFGEGEPDYVGPFIANDGAGFYSPAANDAIFADGRIIHVSADFEFLYATPGTSNVSGVGGLYRGDVDRDGDVDAADIDLLYDNQGIVGTRWDVALNFGQSSFNDVSALVRIALATEFGDADLDDDIDVADNLAWASGFGADSGWAKGDFNGDDIVNAADYVMWRKFFPGGGGGVSPANVPEPASARMVAGAATLLALVSVRNGKRIACKRR